MDHHFVMRVVRESKIDGRTKQPEEYRRLADFFSTHSTNQQCLERMESV